MTSLAEWNTTPAPAGPPVSVLDRIIAILDAVKECEGSITITDIAARTAMPKSTVSRLVAELAAQRYLSRTEEGGAVGLPLFVLGARAGNAPMLRPVVRVTFWGAMAMAATIAIGSLLGTTVG